MVEVTDSTSGASEVMNFAKWFGALALVVCVALIIGHQWPSAFGVAIGVLVFMSATRSVRRLARKPLSATQRSTGILIFAAIQAMVGLVSIFVGELIRGDVVLFFTAIFGTWQMGAAALLAAVARANRRAFDAGKVQ